jgi:hypothetical protein
MAGAAGTGGTSTGGTGGTGPVFDPPWWNPQWAQRWPIHLKNVCGTDLAPGYQIGVRTDGHVTSPAISWRVMRWDGTSWADIPRMVEQAGSGTWVWFGLVAAVPPQNLDDSYWLYEDSVGVVEPPAPTGLFDFHTRFDASEPASWVSTGNVTYATGFVRVDGANSGGSIRSEVTFGPGHALDFAMTVEKPLNNNASWFCGGFQRGADFTNTRPWILWISRKTSSVWPEFWNDATITWKGNETGVDVGTEHVYGIERFARKDVFLRDQQEFDKTEWSADYTTPLQIRFSAYNGSVVQVRWVRVRKACDPRPEVQLGSAESGPL